MYMIYDLYNAALTCICFMRKAMKHLL